MKLQFLFLISLLFASSVAFSQCGDCPTVNNKQPDFCYTSPKLPGKCVAFYTNDTKFYYAPDKGKKISFFLPVNNGLENMLTIHNQFNKKLKADDLLLMQSAIPAWDQAKKNLGYTVTASGLAYKVQEQGTGKKPEAGKKVKVHYKGYLEDGKTFDSSFDRGTPFEFTLGVGQVIKGWDEGIQLFNIGGKGTLKIPSNLGYGERGAGASIPPNSTLYFDIEVLGAD